MKLRILFLMLISLSCTKKSEPPAAPVEVPSLQEEGRATAPPASEKLVAEMELAGPRGTQGTATWFYFELQHVIRDSAVFLNLDEKQSASSKYFVKCKKGVAVLAPLMKWDKATHLVTVATLGEKSAIVSDQKLKPLFSAKEQKVKSREAALKTLDCSFDSLGH